MDFQSFFPAGELPVRNSHALSVFQHVQQLLHCVFEALLKISKLKFYQGDKSVQSSAPEFSLLFLKRVPTLSEVRVFMASQLQWFSDELLQQFAPSYCVQNEHT